jgi:hypothetical protein
VPTPTRPTACRHTKPQRSAMSVRAGWADSEVTSRTPVAAVPAFSVGWPDIWRACRLGAARHYALALLHDPSASSQFNASLDWVARARVPRHLGGADHPSAVPTSIDAGQRRASCSRLSGELSITAGSPEQPRRHSEYLAKASGSRTAPRRPRTQPTFETARRPPDAVGVSGISRWRTTTGLDVHHSPSRYLRPPHGSLEVGHSRPGRRA